LTIKGKGMVNTPLGRVVNIDGNITIPHNNYAAPRAIDDEYTHGFFQALFLNSNDGPTSVQNFPKRILNPFTHLLQSNIEEKFNTLDPINYTMENLQTGTALTSIGIITLALHITISLIAYRYKSEIITFCKWQQTTGKS
jgi:hypothetical protein